MRLEDLPELRYGEVIEVLNESSLLGSWKFIRYYLGNGTFTPVIGSKEDYILVCASFKDNKPINPSHFHIKDTVEIRCYKLQEVEK